MRLAGPIVLVVGMGFVLHWAPIASGTPTCHGEETTIVGTPEDDELVGTSSRDVIASFGGSDEIQSLQGNDLVCAGGGDDRVWGQRGIDELRGGAGDDRLVGGLADPGCDPPPGQACAIVGNDLTGGPGTDSLIGGPNRDVMRAGPGDDLMQAGRDKDYLFGSSGDDQIHGGRATDSLSFTGAPAAVTVDLKEGASIGWGNDLIAGLERVVGSRFPDDIRGDGGLNRLYGGEDPHRRSSETNDLIRGRGGNDVLLGQAGSDRIFGGLGKDYLDGGDGRNDRRPFPDRLAGGPGRDLCVNGERYSGCEKREKPRS